MATSVRSSRRRRHPRPSEGRRSSLNPRNGTRVELPRPALGGYALETPSQARASARPAIEALELLFAKRPELLFDRGSTEARQKSSPTERQILYCSIVRMERLSRLRITDREGLLCVGLTILALLVALVIAASAQADESASGTPPVAGESQEAPNSQSSPESPAAESQSPAPAETTPAETTPAETTPAETTPAEAAPAESSPAEATPAEAASSEAAQGEAAPESGSTTPAEPPEENTVIVSEETTVQPAPQEQGAATPGPEETSSGAAPPESQGPPVETPLAETAPVVVTEETGAAPPAEVTKELTQGGLIETPEEPVGKAPAGEHTESAGEAGSSTPLRSSSLLDTPVAQLAVGRADSASAEAPTASGAGLPVIATIAGTELEGPPPGGGPSAPAHADMTPVERAGGFSCELSQLSGRLTDNCTVGWLGASRFAAAAVPGGLVTAASSLVAATISGTPSEGGHGGIAISSPPVGPAPSSPSPGGAAGAATGGSGVAPLSTFLTLAGLLLLGAPRVLRRLRLSCEPWLAGCFVLVPERPD
jgi:hypothetical protein